MVVIDIDHVAVRALKDWVDEHRGCRREWGICWRRWVGVCEVLLRFGFGLWLRFGFVGRLG